jgi:uncharacterized membrane protein
MSDLETLEDDAGEIESMLPLLEKGELTNQDQIKLAELLKDASPSVVLQATHHQSFSGPIPHPSILEGYSEEVRNKIVEMAVKEQSHTHVMEEVSLDGAIKKDKRGQWMGFGIAVTGLLAAAFIAQFSTAVAGIIAALDLVGLVAIFVAPRLLEKRNN